MALFPAWVPVEPLLLFFVVLVVAVLFVNRGRTWLRNAADIEEPFFIAMGALIAGLNEWLVANVGGEHIWWMAIGGAISLFGLYAYRSDSVDVGGVIG